MPLIDLPPMHDVKSAARTMQGWLNHALDAPQEALCLKVSIENFDAENFFAAISGLQRVYFRSRDQDLELCGIGLAHNLGEKGQLWATRSALLDADQFFMGGMRFDSDRSICPEWQSFGRELFFLPLLQVVKRQQKTTLMLNFGSEKHLPFLVWKDQALSLLEIYSKEHKIPVMSSSIARSSEQPCQSEYAKIIEQAKSAFTARPECRKVVLGRRNIQVFSENIDPIRLFFSLTSVAPKGFSFFLDAGAGAAFFGLSPELLYRRLGRNFETESLAGTRPRSCDEREDARLQQELFNSLKDQVEHALVSEHIEQHLKDFGATDLFTSRLEIMSLPFVQHLVKRYHGNINAALRDDQILSVLHPTPAVCGLERSWALDFIRQHEGFDRGFYAGPIGYIGQDQAEFAVAIRSALYFQQRLYIYAACGIIAESEPNSEWEELNNKQKNIMSILKQF